MPAILPMPIEHIHSTENHMFTHEPFGRTYHQVLFYGSGCSEAVLTYVPQDVDGIVRAHMWIAASQHSAHHSMRASIYPVHGFPGSSHSMFPDAYSVVYFAWNALLPSNKAIAAQQASCCGTGWLGDVLVIKHAGHDLRAYLSMTYDNKALVDVILTWQVFLFPWMWLT
ncbi:hypothetical protein F4604DRAFT_1916863 [Suillus subluteus]|nr:hypothetical protein F4604DRAFT_1916863 [Suillus subluteus]